MYVYTYSKIVLTYNLLGKYFFFLIFGQCPLPPFWKKGGGIHAPLSILAAGLACAGWPTTLPAQPD